MKQLYPLLWRWHFLIGLLAAPVLVIVSLTGALYVFEPQLEPMFESFRQHAACEDCERQPYAELAAHARLEFPNLHIHELVNPGPGFNIKAVLEATDESEVEVFLDPYSGNIVHSQPGDTGLFPFLLRLHRTLLAGEFGRFVTELMISWIFVTLFLGLLLWWPRRAKGAGGWWPRLNAKGRRFWRDLHSVTGFYLLPLLLLIAFTGLFFSPWSGKAMLAGMYVSNQLPALYIKPPKLAEPPTSEARRLPIDHVIDDFVARNNPAYFDIHFPEAPTDLYVLSAHVGFDVWRMSQAHYNPYTGELMGEARWQDLKPGGKALMLFFPLHTGTIFGLGTQIVALLGALAMLGLCLAGIAMWWLRKPQGELGLPEQAHNQSGIPKKTWPLIAALCLLLPAFGASLAVILLCSRLRPLWKRTEQVVQDHA